VVGAGGQARNLKKLQERNYNCIYRILIGLIFSVTLIGSGSALCAKGHYRYAVLAAVGVCASIPLLLLLAAQIWQNKHPFAQNSTRKEPPTWDLDERSRNFRLSRLQSEISVPYTSDLEMIKMERTLQFVNSLKDNDSSYWTGSMNSSKQTSASTPEAGHKAPCALEATYHSDVLGEESSKSAAPDDHPDIGSDEGISSVTSVSPPKEHDIRVPLAIHAIWPKRLASMGSWTAQGRVKEGSRHNDQFSGIGNGRPEGPRDVIVVRRNDYPLVVQQGVGSCSGTVPWEAHVDGKELHGSDGKELHGSERVRVGTSEKTKF
ncbi:unnamed protein product, partial [Ixodes pacificus]